MFNKLVVNVVIFFLFTITFSANANTVEYGTISIENSCPKARINVSTWLNCNVIGESYSPEGKGYVAKVEWTHKDFGKIYTCSYQVAARESSSGQTTGKRLGNKIKVYMNTNVAVKCSMNGSACDCIQAPLR